MFGNMLLPNTFLSALKMSIVNNMRRRSPKLLCEVLKSKNVVCMPNYNVINSYLPFSFFHFSMTTLLQIGVYIFFDISSFHILKFCQKSISIY